MFEVELKFSVPDTAPIEVLLAGWGAQPAPAAEQTDVYFRHPVRDFGETDEALRIRSADAVNCITYKGPVIDPHAKVRREIEIPFAAGTPASEEMASLFVALGFQPVRKVEKRRRPFHLERSGRSFEIAIDEVRGLGTFVEIETLSDESTRVSARDAIVALARDLGLNQAERKSYLCLLLERDRQKS